MRYTVRAITVLALTLGASPARAQNPGLPVYNQGVPRGIALYGDVGFPNDEAGGGTVFGVTGRGGFGPLGVTATLSSFDQDGPGGSDVSVGGTLNYKLLGGPLVPLSVTLQGGVSYLKLSEGFLPDEEVSSYRFPIGVGFALVIPNPVLSIHPWLAPRVDITYQKAGDASNTDTNFGLSGGLEFNLLNGFGIQAAYDRVFAKDVADPATFGIGAHYAFRVPGL
jgi:Outer membrane protein beta-barrel domain